MKGRAMMLILALNLARGTLRVPPNQFRRPSRYLAPARSWSPGRVDRHTRLHFDLNTVNFELINDLELRCRTKRHVISTLKCKMFGYLQTDSFRSRQDNNWKCQRLDESAKVIVDENRAKNAKTVSKTSCLIKSALEKE